MEDEKIGGNEKTSKEKDEQRGRIALVVGDVGEWRLEPGDEKLSGDSNAGRLRYAGRMRLREESRGR